MGPFLDPGIDHVGGATVWLEHETEVSAFGAVSFHVHETEACGGEGAGLSHLSLPETCAICLHVQALWKGMTLQCAGLVKTLHFISGRRCRSVGDA